MAKARKVTAKKSSAASKDKSREIKLKLQETVRNLAAVKKSAKANEKELREHFKAVAAKAAHDAYQQGVLDTLSEIEKKDHAKAKVLAAAEAKFEKKFASKLAKKAKSSKKSPKIAAPKAAKAKAGKKAKATKAKTVKAKSSASRRPVAKKTAAGRRGRKSHQAQVSHHAVEGAAA